MRSNDKWNDLSYLDKKKDFIVEYPCGGVDPQCSYGIEPDGVNKAGVVIGPYALPDEDFWQPHGYDNPCYQLTGPECNEKGAIWFDQVGINADGGVSPGNSLETTAYLNFGDDKDGYSGMSFLIQKEGNDWMSGWNECNGGELGYMSCLEEYVAVEFDTYISDDVPQSDDIYCHDHIAIYTKKDGVLSGPLADYEFGPWRCKKLENGKWRYVRIKFDFPTQNLRVYMVPDITGIDKNGQLINPGDRGAPLNAYDIDLNDIFGMDNGGFLYYGFIGTSPKIGNDGPFEQQVCIPRTGTFDPYFHFDLMLKRGMENGFHKCVFDISNEDAELRAKLSIDPIDMGYPAEDKLLRPTLLGPECLTGDPGEEVETTASTAALAAFEPVIPVPDSGEDVAELNVNINKDVVAAAGPGYYDDSDPFLVKMNFCIRVDYLYTGDDIDEWLKDELGQLPGYEGITELSMMHILIGVHLTVNMKEGWELGQVLMDSQEGSSIDKRDDIDCPIKAYRCGPEEMPVQLPLIEGDNLKICLEVSKTCPEDTYIESVWDMFYSQPDSPLYPDVKVHAVQERTKISPLSRVGTFLDPVNPDIPNNFDGVSHPAWVRSEIPRWFFSKVDRNWEKPLEIYGHVTLAFGTTRRLVTFGDQGERNLQDGEKEEFRTFVGLQPAADPPPQQKTLSVRACKRVVNCKLKGKKFSNKVKTVCGKAYAKAKVCTENQKQTRLRQKRLCKNRCRKKKGKKARAKCSRKC
jgi:hypothetical protein